ncbi:hypothetical protein UY775_15120 [Escherichia coli]|nr:hypothetical protein [Escherichia coli]MDY8698487.1 hypothetical protein [Escherichia coli]MDY8725036.1 hypothetical protein [Escherichia coli]MDY8846062.1 hypothetical protein [Escherichia coli]
MATNNNVKPAGSGRVSGKSTSEAYTNSCEKSGASMLMQVLVRASGQLNELPKAPKGEAAGKKASPKC